MNYITCVHCGDDLVVTFEDRLHTPMLVDILIERHRAVCDAYLDLAGDVLATEVEAALRKAAS